MRNFWLILLLLSGCGGDLYELKEDEDEIKDEAEGPPAGDQYHCRITGAVSYETGQPLPLPLVNEFTVQVETTTDIYRAGDVLGLPYGGTLILDTGGQRKNPLVVFSKLDGKFDRMFIDYQGGSHVEGFCKEIGLF